MNHEPGPSTTQSAARTASTASGHGVGSGGSSATEAIAPAVVATSTWPRTVGQRVGVGRVEAADLGGDVERRERHRQHPARRPSSRPTQSSAATGSPSSSQRPTISRLPIAWPCISPWPGEPVLQHPGPGVAPLVVAAQRGQRHPQVAGREHAELAAQPARRAAVVGDGDHGGQVVDDEVVRRAGGARAARRRGRARPRGRRRTGRGRASSSASLPAQVAVGGAGVEARRRAAGGRSPRSSRRCGACRRCSRSRPS